jgi:hypothetical protein
MSLTNRAQFSSTLDIKLKIQLKELSNETKVPISKLLDESVELLLKHRRVTRDINIRNTAQKESIYHVEINMDDK